MVHEQIAIQEGQTEHECFQEITLVRQCENEFRQTQIIKNKLCKSCGEYSNHQIFEKKYYYYTDITAGSQSPTYSIKIIIVAPFLNYVTVDVVQKSFNKHCKLSQTTRVFLNQI